MRISSRATESLYLHLAGSATHHSAQLVDEENDRAYVAASILKHCKAKDGGALGPAKFLGPPLHGHAGPAEMLDRCWIKFKNQHDTAASPLSGTGTNSIAERIEVNPINLSRFLVVSSTPEFLKNC